MHEEKVVGASVSGACWRWHSRERQCAHMCAAAVSRAEAGAPKSPFRFMATMTPVAATVPVPITISSRLVSVSKAFDCRKDIFPRLFVRIAVFHTHSDARAL